MAKKKREKPKQKSLDVERESLKERLARNRLVVSTESPVERRSRLDRLHAEAPSPGRGSPQFIVRYPDEAMRAKLARLAKANNRSINAEIVDRLQKSMIDDAIQNLEESMGEIFDRVEKLEAIVRDHEDQLDNR